jgi:hypothetical protein
MLVESVASQSPSESVSQAGMPKGVPYEEFFPDSTHLPAEVTIAPVSARQIGQ